MRYLVFHFFYQGVDLGFPRLINVSLIELLVFDSNTRKYFTVLKGEEFPWLIG